MEGACACMQISTHVNGGCSHLKLHSHEWRKCTPATCTNRAMRMHLLLTRTPVLCWAGPPRWKGLGLLIYNMDKTDWLQVSKGMRQRWILSPYLFSFYAEYILWEAGMENVCGFKIDGRDINNLC